ncbi:tetratricopeptide repeat protein [Zhaonella formicivorans]|uniref:tetratricopeptide repeat protein n=1 Tax=Zhaonella formicivorans TaxID=2528593 RepID=UPI0010CEED94|nr:tetratricopeptide repeat protein [Zhaonella formicivorans]
MMLKAIRKHKRAAKIPLIILVIVLSVGLVGSFMVWQAPSADDFQATGASGGNSQLQSLRANIRQYEQAVKTNPNNVNLLVALANNQYDLGVQYFDVQNYEEGAKFFKAAVKSYQKALEQQPQNINIRVDLATAAFYSAQYDLAEEHYKKAIEQDPKFLNARMNYGIFLYNVRNDKKGAIAQWQAALETKPDAATAERLKKLIESAGE